ncbi:hypothetical protein B0H66DRAFT_559305 [Apodospora peruviana]|uniref:Uncharacterized protein n=1 Tax=Apodospora peruviana TaxID=516989 RepID=A0AAE0I6D6_9PEZI|nr:hypothetical protein B0H66DRAFT_559305 [Apodospora peruviana]
MLFSSFRALLAASFIGLVHQALATCTTKPQGYCTLELMAIVYDDLFQDTLEWEVANVFDKDCNNIGGLSQHGDIVPGTLIQSDLPWDIEITRLKTRGGSGDYDNIGFKYGDLYNFVGFFSCTAYSVDWPNYTGDINDCVHAFPCSG